MDSPFLLCTGGHLQCSPHAQAGCGGGKRGSSSMFLSSLSGSDCCASFSSQASLEGRACSISDVAAAAQAFSASLLGGDDDDLACGESFEDELPLEDDDTQDFGQAPSTAPRACSQRSSCMEDGFDRAEACEAIGHHLRAQAELLPARSCQRVAADVYAKVVSWLVQACTSLGLQRSTLFAAVGNLSRFIHLSEILPPTSMLQLLALSCLTLAAKAEEVQQYHVVQWLQLAAGSDDKPLFTADDLGKMEWLVLETLEWRMRAPNAYSFLQHFLHVLSGCGDDAGVLPADMGQRQMFVSYAHFLTELALLSDAFLDYKPSTIAVACLVLSEWATKGSAEADDWAPRTSPALQSVVPLELCDLRPCVEELHELYKAAMSGERASDFAAVTARYTAPLCAGAQ